MKTKEQIEALVKENKEVIATQEKALRMADDIESSMLMEDIRMLKKEISILEWVLK